MFWALVLDVPTGIIADRYSRRLSLVLGSLIFGLGMFVYGSFPSFAVFLFAEFLSALGSAFISGAGDAFLYDSLQESNQKDQSQKVFGHIYSISQVATILGALLGGFVAKQLGLNYPILLSIFPCTVAAIFLLFASEPKAAYHQISDTKLFTTAISGFKYLKNHLQLRELVINAILPFSAIYFFIWLYQPLLLLIKIDVSWFGVIRSLFAVAGIVVASNILFINKVFKSSRNTIKFCLIITIISLFSIIFWSNIFIIISAVMLIGGFGYTRMTLQKVEMNKLISSENRATVLSSISVLNSLILVVLNPIVGFIADRSLRSALLFITILPLVALLLPERHRLK